MLLCDRALTFLNDIVDKFLDSPAMHANDMVMMQASLQFKDRLASLEVVPRDQPRRFELGEGAIDCSQPDLISRILQFPIDGFGSQMLTLSAFK